MEVLIILIFILLVVASPFVFVGWMVVSIVRAVAGGVSGATRTIRHATGVATDAAGLTVRCPVDGCHAVNPSDARFCRRCGHGLPAAMRVQVRRAACW
jgi:hypothetical protein